MHQIIYIAVKKHKKIASPPDKLRKFGYTEISGTRILGKKV